jgi:hypothetical protein
MFYKAKVAVCSETRTKRINTLCGENAGMSNVNPLKTKSICFI